MHNQLEHHLPSGQCEHSTYLLAIANVDIQATNTARRAPIMEVCFGADDNHVHDGASIPSLEQKVTFFCGDVSARRISRGVMHSWRHASVSLLKAQ
mmetsp:Transcript_24324/g.44651  ORF Transcript_24324/g.44651 Transcript_24324/m.44651 type:complete len:96 (-) Transcript_24324:429-716(-)